MKTLALLSPLAVLTLLASCSSTVDDRIQENPAAFNALPDSQKAEVAQGKVSRGMSPEAVKIAWGEPDAVSSGNLNGKASERWLYDLGGGSGWTFGVGGGVGRGYSSSGLGLGTGVSIPIGFVPNNFGYVLFVDGKVNSWEGK